MQKKLTLAALALALVAGAGWFATRAPDPGPGFAAAEAQTAVTEADLERVVDMTLGAEDAPVTVIEYASFTCPHCANFHANVFGRLKADYIDTGKVRFVHREVYFDRFGLWAGMIARCGGEERYFGIVDLIYSRQRDWAGSGDPGTVAAALRTIGKTAGLSDETIDACMADQTMAQAMVNVFQENATRDDINATPSFMIDGQKYSNMSYEDFSRVLDGRLGG